jgi:hypothetical protein
MDRNALARQNHAFYYVDLPMQCLFSESFLDFFARAASIGRHNQEYPAQPLEEEQQFPFQCGNGEFGYLRFKAEDARQLQDLGVTSFGRVANRIPRSIGGELNERCEVKLENGNSLVFTITCFEGDTGAGCVKIEDPITECPDATPLGRMVEMSLRDSSAP